jgi:hypothetical protein
VFSLFVAANGDINKNKNMAKPQIKKASTPASPAPATRKTRERKTVLVKVTATKLKELLGADVEIGVSRKELTALLTKKTSVDVLADAGIA